MDDNDHLLDAIAQIGRAAGTYDLRGWDIRFTSTDALGEPDVIAAHEQMHAVLTERTAWGSVLLAGLEDHRLDGDDSTRRRLINFVGACRRTQEVLATYVSIAHRAPAILANYEPGVVDFAYRRFLEDAVDTRPELPALSAHRTELLTAMCMVAMQPAALTAALETGRARFPLSAVRRRDHPDVRLATMLATGGAADGGRGPAPRWVDRMTRRGAGAQIRYRVDFGRAAMSDAGIETLYASLSRDLLAATGSPTLEWDGQVAFAERLLAQYQTEGRDLGLYTENTFGVELTPRMEHLGFISRERIVVRGEQLAANLTTPAAVLADARPVITVRPKGDWLAEYRWTDGDRARIAAGQRDVPLLVRAHETDPVVQACLVPPSSPEYSALIASHGSQVTVAVSARYFAPALTERYPLTPESTVMRLLAETGEHSGRQVVVLDIELNIIVALWAFLEHRMLVGRIPLQGIAGGGGELTAFVARRDDGDLPFLGVCRTDRCVQLVNDLPLLAAGSFTARAADAIVDVAWASQIAGHIIGSRSFVGMSPVEETPL